MTTPRAIIRARDLRRRQTEAERRLWSKLRAGQLDGHKFRRQHPVGPYVVDFACLEEGLAIELDGGQHAMQGERDEARSRFLASRGYTVLRFWNHEVLAETHAVLAAIARELAAKPQRSKG